MLTHPQFDPILFSIGPLAIRWYGLMYVVAFISFLMLTKLRVKRGYGGTMTVNDVDDLLLYGVLGVILGGRLGYILFYKAGFYFSHPLEIFKVWEGGMSFHGGFLGVLLAVALFCWRRKKRWIEVMDLIAPAVPVGLAAGRLGNFINGELPGRVTDVPWGVVFRGVGDAPRHPSQLYQFALEGVALFALLWWFSSKPRPRGQVSGVFLIGYGVFRFLVEFAREPDSFLGFLALGMTMGQWLCLPMIAGGIALFVWSRR
jgi:phosphatidylglycerol:prolipoprotein diacylglycerol transferase